MDDGSLYETDFLTWTREQAAALRRLPARENAGLDLENLIEEVETLGRSELSKVRSALFRLMEHAALVALAGPGHRDARHWLGEMVAFRLPAADYRPSMRQYLEPELPDLWLSARDAACAKLGRPSADLPDAPPFALGDLVRGGPPDELVAALRAAAPQG